MKSKMKIVSVVVLYHPNQEALKPNLDAIVPYVDALLLWNNTPARMPNPYVHDKVIYINHGENVGLPRAYNYAWHYAQTHGFTHVLTMDQDSYFPRLDDFLAYIQKRNEVALFGPYVPSVGVPRLVEECQSVLSIINSGACVPVEILNHVHGYNEDFFMDIVDEEFCLHARALGYVVYQVKAFNLQHCYGKLHEVKWLGKTVARVANYSSMRVYGICRNKLIMWRNYSVHAELKRRKVWEDVKSFIKMLCFEQNKWSKCCAYCIGYYDGILNRPSRIQKFMK